jgi:hypothetical protein
VLKSDIGERIRPHRSEISEVIAPYLVRRVSVHSQEWQEHYETELKKWRRQLWRRRLRKFGFKLKREQEKVREHYSATWMKRAWPSPGDTTMPVLSYDWKAEGLKLWFLGPQTGSSATTLAVY